MRVGPRIESSPTGQAALSAAMVVVIVCVVLWNLPPGCPRDAVRPAAGTVVQALGLEQDWGLFAPDPREYGVGIVATVTHRDGRRERWLPPARGRFLAPYRTYRWQKYVERLRADEYPWLWEPFARWVARNAGPGVTRVSLTRTFRAVVVPGQRGPRPPAERFTFYTLELG